ncbi:hypothetical protein D9M69_519710 [compost metagenome]
MKTLEEKFGQKHPALEEFREPPPAFRWLPDAFFRLHRRRQLTESGYQPLPSREIADFGRRILRLDNTLFPLFVRCMEEADNAVLYDHYAKSKEDAERRAAEAKKPRRKR